MTDDFSNVQIDVASLPTVEDVDFKKVHKEYLNVQLISWAIFWGIVIIGVLLWLTLNSIGYAAWIDFLGIGIISSLIGLSVFFAFKLHARRGYAIRTRDILYKEGYLWRSLTVIPFNRIQHAEVEQGPIDRLFNLSQIKIYTAGGSSSDLVIPGLRPEESESIKYFVINKTALDEEE